MVKQRDGGEDCARDRLEHALGDLADDHRGIWAHGRARLELRTMCKWQASRHRIQALTWAATLADRAGRQMSLQLVLGEAPEESRQALSAVLNTLPLSHEEKALLRLLPAP